MLLKAKRKHKSDSFLRDVSIWSPPRARRQAKKLGDKTFNVNVCLCGARELANRVNLSTREKLSGRTQIVHRDKALKSFKSLSETKFHMVKSWILKHFYCRTFCFWKLPQVKRSDESTVEELRPWNGKKFYENLTFSKYRSMCSFVFRKRGLFFPRDISIQIMAKRWLFLTTLFIFVEMSLSINKSFFLCQGDFVWWHSSHESSCSNKSVHFVVENLIPTLCSSAQTFTTHKAMILAKSGLVN